MCHVILRVSALILNHLFAVFICHVILWFAVLTVLVLNIIFLQFVCVMCYYDLHELTVLILNTMCFCSSMCHMIL